MSCHSQHGPQTYLKFIEEATGERIKQTDWHAIRELAATEAGGKLSRATADPDDTHDAALELAACINYEQGITYGLDADGDRVEDYRADELVKAVAGVKNTTGTVAAINYLAAHGVTDTLRKVRKQDGDAPAQSDPFAPTPDDGRPKGLPYLRQEMTQVEADQMVDWLAKQPTDDLKRRNAVGHDKMLKAAARGDDEEVLSERVELDMVADALSRQTSGEPKTGLHSDVHSVLMHKRRFEALGMTGTEAMAAAENEMRILDRETAGFTEQLMQQGNSEAEARKLSFDYFEKRSRAEFEAAFNRDDWEV